MEWRERERQRGARKGEKEGQREKDKEEKWDEVRWGRGIHGWHSKDRLHSVRD